MHAYRSNLASIVVRRNGFCGLAAHTNRCHAIFHQPNSVNTLTHTVCLLPNVTAFFLFPPPPSLTFREFVSRGMQRGSNADLEHQQRLDPP